MPDFLDDTRVGFGALDDFDEDFELDFELDLFVAEFVFELEDFDKIALFGVIFDVVCLVVVVFEAEGALEDFIDELAFVDNFLTVGDFAEFDGVDGFDSIKNI